MGSESSEDHILEEPLDYPSRSPFTSRELPERSKDTCTRSLSITRRSSLESLSELDSLLKESQSHYTSPSTKRESFTTKRRSSTTKRRLSTTRLRNTTRRLFITKRRLSTTKRRLSTTRRVAHTRRLLSTKRPRSTHTKSSRSLSED